MCLPYTNPSRTYRLVGLGFVLGPRSELKIAGHDRTSRIIDDHAPHSPKQLVNAYNIVVFRTLSLSQQAGLHYPRH